MEQFIADGRDLLTTPEGQILFETIATQMPPEFFTDVTSKRKMHVVDSLLKAHSLNCGIIAKRLAKAWGFNTFGIELDRIIIAALVHDGWKRWDGPVIGWGEHTKDHHAQIAEHTIRLMFTGSQDAACVAELVSTHMSMWGMTAQPIHTLAPAAQVVAVADYCEAHFGLSGLSEDR